MFTTILWATDGSPAADAALPEIKKLVGENGSSLIAFHVDENMVGGRASGQPLYADEEDVRSKIESQVAELATEGIHVRSEVVSAAPSASSAAHAIAAAARQDGADLIVVGTRGHTVLGGLLVGSVTQRLMHISPCPVLAVPGER